MDVKESVSGVGDCFGDTCLGNLGDVEKARYGLEWGGRAVDLPSDRHSLIVVSYAIHRGRCNGTMHVTEKKWKKWTAGKFTLRSKTTHK